MQIPHSESQMPHYIHLCSVFLLWLMYSLRETSPASSIKTSSSRGTRQGKDVSTSSSSRGWNLEVVNEGPPMTIENEHEMTKDCHSV